MRNIFFLLFLSLVSFSGALAQNAAGAPDPTGITAIGSTLTVQQAVAIAIKNNLLINEADIQAQLNRVALSQAWDNMLPTLNASANQNEGFGRSLNSYNYQYVNSQINSGSYGVSAGLNLFNGLQVQNGIKQNRYGYQGSLMDLQQQKDNITLNVILAYLQVLSNQDVLTIAREQADVDKKNLDRLNVQNKEGALVVLSDVSDLQGQYALDMGNIAADINALETSKVTLFQYLNVPYKRDVQYENNATTLQVNDNEEAPSPDSVFQMALRIIPSIKSADLWTQYYQKALAVAKGAYYPSLSFNAGVNTSYSNAASTAVPLASTEVVTNDYVTIGGTKYNVVAQQNNSTSKSISFGDQFKNNRYTQLGLSLNIPILNNLRVRNNVKRARLNLKNQEYVTNNAKLALQQNVEMAFQNMIAAYKQYKYNIDQAAAFGESFRITEIRFNEGVITSNVYLLAKNNTDRSNLSQAQSKYIFIFRKKVLDYYQGKLNLQ